MPVSVGVHNRVARNGPIRKGRAMQMSDLHPPLGLTVRAGDLELRGITDELLLEVCKVAEEGIHDPDEMPFYFPWSTAPRGELSRNTANYHWGTRASFGPDEFRLELAVIHRGEVIGCQGVSARNFPVTRTGETGSWLGRRHQGQGIGTAMRQAMCALLFDHLGFEEILSGAFVDNPASLAVSRKVGYVPTSTERFQRREGELAINQRLLLTPEAFVRGSDPVQVTGADAVRRAIGLDVERS